MIACTTCGLLLIACCFDGTHSCLPVGTRVKLNVLAHTDMHDMSREHSDEMRGQLGTVLGHAERNWPEVDVEFDSGLKYCYPATWLEIITEEKATK